MSFKFSYRLLSLESMMLGIICVLLVYYAQKNQWFWRVDQLIYDAQLRTWQQEAPDDVVIIAIDEASLLEIGRWPWPRSVHAQLLKELHKAQAKAVFFDVLFAEKDQDDRQGDQEFIRAVKTNNNIFLPVIMEQLTIGGQLIETLPFPELANVAAGLGHVHAEIDLDGIVRSVYLREGVGSPHWEHLSQVVLNKFYADTQKYNNKQTDGNNDLSSHLLKRSGQIYIPFAGPPGHFNHVSYIDVLQGKIPIQLLKDKFIFIGATAAGIGDSLPTPVSGYSHEMSGVELNANLFVALRANSVIKKMDLRLSQYLSILFVLIPIFIFQFATPRFNVLLTLTAMIGIHLLSFYYIKQHLLWMPTAAALFSLLIAYPVWSWRRLEKALRYINDELVSTEINKVSIIHDKQDDIEQAIKFYGVVFRFKGWKLIGKDGVVLHASGESLVVPDLMLLSDAWVNCAGARWVKIILEQTEVYLGILWPQSAPEIIKEEKIIEQLLHALKKPYEEVAVTQIEMIERKIKQLQQENEKGKRLQAYVQESISEMVNGVVVVDILGNVTIANKYAAIYLRNNDTDLRGESILDLLGILTAPSSQYWENILSVVLLGEVVEPLEIKHPNGRELLVQISPIKGISLGDPFIIVNLSDITKLKESENKRSEALNFLSHDLRSPIVSLLALLELAKNKNDAEEIKKQLSRMSDYANNALVLAEQFLSLARAELGGDLNLQDVELVDIVSNAINQVWVLAATKHITLDTMFDMDCAWITGDADLLQRAFVNILSNAIKYSPNETLITIAITTNKAMNAYICCIKDQGYGIEETEIDLLFGRFYRSKNIKHQKEDGAGLGLAFVDVVLKKHNAKMEVQSSLGHGTEFCLTLAKNN